MLSLYHIFLMIGIISLSYSLYYDALSRHLAYMLTYFQFTLCATRAFCAYYADDENLSMPHLIHRLAVFIACLLLLYRSLLLRCGALQIFQYTINMAISSEDEIFIR